MNNPDSFYYQRHFSDVIWGVYMSRISKWKLFPNYHTTEVINISSIVGSRHLDFLYLGLSGGCLQSGNPIGYPAEAGVWGPPHSLSLQILQAKVVRSFRELWPQWQGLYLRPIIGTIYNYIGIVISCALSSTWYVSMDLPLCSVGRQLSAPIPTVYRFGWSQGQPSEFFIFYDDGLSVQLTFSYAGCLTKTGR